MKESINLAWRCEEEDISDSSLPIVEQLFSELQESYEEYKRNMLNDFEEEEMLSLMQLGEDVENAVSQVNEFVTYTSIWHGRVLEELEDTILAHIIKKQEEEKEFFVKIAKSKIEQSQRSKMIPGALFDWAFGYKGSDATRKIWKFEFHQAPNPTPEAIQNMVKRMTMGLEHLYDDQD